MLNNAIKGDYMTADNDPSVSNIIYDYYSFLCNLGKSNNSQIVNNLIFSIHLLNEDSRPGSTFFIIIMIIYLFNRIAC